MGMLRTRTADGRSRPAPRSRSRGRPVVALALALLLVTIAAVPVAAAEFLSGDDPSVPAGTTFDEDVYLAGGEALIAGTVTRDVIVASGELDVTGRIDGNLIAAAGNVDVRGPIGRSLRVAAGELRVAAPVGGDVVAASGDVTIEPGAVVAGDVVAAGGNVTIRGEVRGEVRVAGGELVIDGPVGGEVRAEADELRLGPNARLAAALFYDGNEPEMDQGATVAGPVEERDLGDEVDPIPGPDLGGFWFGVFRLLAALVTGAAVVLLLPRAAVAAADAIRARPGPAFLLGLGLLVVLPIALVVLMVTVVGIPLALVGWAVYAVALYLSQVFVGLAIGWLILARSRLGGDTGRGFNLLAMAIGVVVLGVLRLLPIPFFGGLVAVLTAIAGLGALALAFDARRRGRMPVAAPA